jgi:hypothetical protein
MAADVSEWIRAVADKPVLEIRVAIVVPESGVKEPILAQVMARSFAILVRMWWAKFSIWGVL